MLLLVAICVASCVVSAEQSAISTTAQQRSDKIPRDSVPQNRPCAKQFQSLQALRRAFTKGKTPSPVDMTGSWVAIGFFGGDSSALNCAGLKRGPIFEEVMLAKGYSLEMHVIGTFDQSPTMRREADGSVTFPFDFGGKASPVYRCRMTAGKTLACMIDVYRQGVEFKKIPVQENEISSPKRRSPNL